MTQHASSLQARAILTHSNFFSSSLPEASSSGSYSSTTFRLSSDLSAIFMNFYRVLGSSIPCSSTFTTLIIPVPVVGAFRQFVPCIFDTSATCLLKLNWIWWLFPEVVRLLPLHSLHSFLKCFLLTLGFTSASSRLSQSLVLLSISRISRSIAFHGSFLVELLPCRRLCIVSRHATTSSLVFDVSTNFSDVLRPRMSYNHKTTHLILLPQLIFCLTCFVPTPENIFVHVYTYYYLEQRLVTWTPEWFCWVDECPSMRAECQHCIKVSATHAHANTGRVCYIDCAFCHCSLLFTSLSPLKKLKMLTFVEFTNKFTTEICALSQCISTWGCKVSCTHVQLNWVHVCHKESVTCHVFFH